MNVHLLTLSALGDGDYLLRLEHQFELDEGTLGKPVNVSLSVSLSACMYMHCHCCAQNFRNGGNFQYFVYR